MNDFWIAWLLLAGPLWALIGGVFIPRLLEPSEGHASALHEGDASFRLGGAAAGFALGPFALGYLYWRRPPRMPRGWLAGNMLIGVLLASIVAFNLPDIRLAILLWLLLAGPAWAVLGAYIVPRRYRQLGLDDTQALMVGVLGGFAAGPLVLAPLWYEAPKLSGRWSSWLALLSGWQIIALYSFYARSYSDVYCFIYPGNMTYLSQQLVNGINIGLIYALMAVGLTLIYSVQGIVSFTHAQFYMLGGYCSYWLLEVGTNSFGVDINPLLGIPVAAVATFLIGAVFERLLLRPMHLGKVERINEYAILITFGFGFFLESFVLSTQGPLPVKVGRYLDVRRFELVLTADRERVLGPIRFLGDRTFTALIGVALILALMYFFRRTWTGRALRAVSMDKQAAAVAGINPLNMNTLAFGLGAMLAGISGAALIPIFNFVPWIGQVNAGRAYIIVVLGGLGSIPGALIGGIIIGLVETMGSGCLAGGDRAAAYKDVYGLLIFVLVLLIKPTGLFGREQL